MQFKRIECLVVVLFFIQVVSSGFMFHAIPNITKGIEIIVIIPNIV